MPSWPELIKWLTVLKRFQGKTQFWQTWNWPSPSVVNITALLSGPSPAEVDAVGGWGGGGSRHIWWLLASLVSFAARLRQGALKDEGTHARNSTEVHGHPSLPSSRLKSQKKTLQNTKECLLGRSLSSGWQFWNAFRERHSFGKHGTDRALP